MKAKILFLLSFLALNGSGAPTYVSDRVPLVVQEKTFSPTFKLSANIEPFDSEEINVRWYGLVRKIGVAPGQQVKKGQLIAEVEVKYLELQKDYLETRKKFIESNLERTRFDEASFNSQVLRMRELARKEIVAASEVDSLQMKLNDIVGKKMKLEGELKELTKSLGSTNEQIQNANYYATQDGTVTDLIINPKQFTGSLIVMPGSRLARIDKPGTYLAIAKAIDTQMVHLTLGKKATIQIEGTGDTFVGEIVRLDEAREKNKMYEVWIKFVKQGPILNQGLLATVTFTLPGEKKSIVIPWNAVEVTPEKTFVSVLDPQKGQQRREVRLGRRMEHQTEVLSGLKVGEIIEAALW